MQGTLFLLFIVLLAIVLIVLGMSTIFLIPLVVLALAALFAVPLLALFRREEHGTPRTDPSGVPSTHEASYDPVQEP